MVKGGVVEMWVVKGGVVVMWTVKGGKNRKQ